jgi:hypothetical protein
MAGLAMGGGVAAAGRDIAGIAGRAGAAAGGVEGLAGRADVIGAAALGRAEIGAAAAGGMAGFMLAGFLAVLVDLARAVPGFALAFAADFVLDFAPRAGDLRAEAWRPEVLRLDALRAEVLRPDALRFARVAEADLRFAFLPPKAAPAACFAFFIAAVAALRILFNALAAVPVDFFRAAMSPSLARFTTSASHLYTTYAGGGNGIGVARSISAL